MRKLIFFLLPVLLLLIKPALALERFEIITTEQLEAMLKARAAGTIDFVLVNSLDEIIFRNSSIPGSVNVPWSKVKDKLPLLGEDKGRLLVFY